MLSKQAWIQRRIKGHIDDNFTVFALIFVPQQNEKYYDCSGAIGWATTAFLSLYYPALKARYWNGISVPLPSLSSFAPRQLLLSAAVGLWTVRLGSFLTLVSSALFHDEPNSNFYREPSKPEGTRALTKLRNSHSSSLTIGLHKVNICAKFN